MLFVPFSVWLVFIAARACCLVVFHLSTGTPRSFSAELLSGESGHVVLLHSVAPSKMQDLTFVLPELQEVFIASFFHTPKVLQIGVLFFSLATTSLNLVSSQTC